MMLGLSFGLGGIGTMLTSSIAEWIGLSMALGLTTALLVISVCSCLYNACKFT